MAKQRADDVVSHPRNRRLLSGRSRNLLLTFGLALVLLLTSFQSWLRWSYHIHRAASLSALALSWPTPRQSDSLPQLADAQAAEQALAQLENAIARRPDHAYAYSQAAEIYLARGELSQAAEAIEQSRQRAPLNTELAWRAGRIYEELMRTVDEAPSEHLLDTLLAGDVELLASIIETPYCQPGNPASCVMARGAYKQPLAALPDARPLGADVLFLHPPSKVRSTLRVSPEHSALTFLLGLDPELHAGPSDGATFRIWVEQGGAAELVFERALDGATARQGWQTGWADLSRWAGQEVTLALGVDGGPASNIDGDWYGWGDLRLTSVEAARHATLRPDLRMIESWLSAGIDDAQLLQRGNEAAEMGRPREALTWYWRAQRINPVSWPALHRSGLAFAAQHDDQTAIDLYQRALEIQPENYEVSVSLAEALWRQGYPAEARPLLEQAIERDPNRVAAYRALGVIQRAQGDLAGARESFGRALTLRPKSKDLQNLLDSVNQQQ